MALLYVTHVTPNFLTKMVLSTFTFKTSQRGNTCDDIRCEYPALACLQQNSQQMSSHVAPLSRISCTRFRTKCADKLW